MRSEDCEPNVPHRTTGDQSKDLQTNRDLLFARKSKSLTVSQRSDIELNPKMSVKDASALSFNQWALAMTMTNCGVSFPEGVVGHVLLETLVELTARYSLDTAVQVQLCRRSVTKSATFGDEDFRCEV